MNMNFRFKGKDVGPVARFTVFAGAALAILVTPIASHASPSKADAPRTATVQSAARVPSKPPRLSKSRARGKAKAIAKADCKDRLIDHRHDAYPYKCLVHQPDCSSRYDDYRVWCIMDYALVAQLKRGKHPDYNWYCTGAIMVTRRSSSTYASPPQPEFNCIQGFDLGGGS
jgi:hypothetical protein